MSEFTPLLVVPAPAPPTMPIASDDTESGYIIINASDFDAATMTAFVAPEPDATPKKGK